MAATLCAPGPCSPWLKIRFELDVLTLEEVWVLNTAYKLYGHCSQTPSRGHLDLAVILWEHDFKAMGSKCGLEGGMGALAHFRNPKSTINVKLRFATGDLLKTHFRYAARTGHPPESNHHIA